MGEMSVIRKSSLARCWTLKKRARITVRPIKIELEGQTPTMLNVTCAACGKVSTFEPSMAGRQGKCVGCEAVLKVPRLSATSQAIQEAMRAMDAKEAKRKGKGKDKKVGSASAQGAYDLGTAKKTEPAALATGKTMGKAMGKSAAKASADPEVTLGKEKFVITPKQKKILTGVVGSALVIAIAWYAFVPSEWESLHRAEYIQMKGEADQLASAGKPAEAYARYQRLMLMGKGHSAKSSDLRQAMRDSEASANQLLEEHRAIIEKARAASARE